ELEEHKTLTLPILPLLFFTAMYPGNIYEVFNVMQYISYFGAGFIFTIPVTLYLIAVIRNIKGDARR
ncbi:MAG: spore gernimation protein, partial [bacterium]